ncbi:IS1096 element passenger TnpR family protein [Phocicoccus pinnipedialis]|uniref:Plasmid pRiA4b ORF-3-like protein n=1 Tax=Phocicoccus pinnipedialis TaxID=110845 RepID=A0A6V7R3R5_9BACL|nr:hypothetical protein [Jeotgalicoccus pinnipedialis]MBP1940015.1 hypothetical protein [Jeotgalicoccus pinnipedialis]CAD2072037.1 Plasmid pRiA4b ORF-3-like protein [Jeotgalicoccus pinnipedialis]
MELREFYSIYMGEDALLRATLIHSRDFLTIDDYIDFKLDDFEDENQFNKMVDVLSMAEAKRIHDLVDEDPDNNVYHVKNKSHYGTLYDFQYMLEEDRNSYVIHRDVVHAIDQALLNRGIMSPYNMRIGHDESLEPEEISKLSNMYTGPIYWLYDNLTSTQLKKIISTLGITHYGKYKDDFLKAVISYITAPGHLPHVLEHLSYKDLTHIEEMIRDNYNVFERKPRWSVAEKIGLLVKVHPDYLVMHQDVLEALRTIDFKKIETREQEDANYNAYHIHATIEGKREIKRDIVIPVRLNFYELMYILKESFLWTNGTNSKIKIGGYEIYEKEGTLSANIVQVDHLFNKYQSFKFYYDSDDNYEVNVSLIGTRIVDREVPKVTEYRGPIPIENIGGIEKLNDALEVLEDETHIDYARTYNKARSENYRERFPITAINKNLSRKFMIRRPMTE